MLRGKYRYRKFLANKALKSHKRNLRFKEKHSQRLILKSKGIAYINNLGRAFKKCIRKKILNIEVPAYFDMETHHDTVLGFVSELLNNRDMRKIKQINIDLEKVVLMDFQAICLLLSVIDELTNNGIKVIGNYPNDEFCKKVFMESGFLSKMLDADGKPFDIKTKNFILETGHTKTKNQHIAKAIMSAMESFLGKKRRFQPIYTIIMEVCSNSVEHAYNNRPKHWRLGICQKDDKIIFTMVDTGVGILKTLHRKFYHILSDRVTYNDDTDILYNAFKRKYGSSTELVNRNKGLPCVLDKFNKGYIKNLKLCTNKVLLDFNNPKNKISLNNDFKGVLFYWELDKNCIDNFDNDKKIV